MELRSPLLSFEHRHGSEEKSKRINYLNSLHWSFTEL